MNILADIIEFLLFNLITGVLCSCLVTEITKSNDDTTINNEIIWSKIPKTKSFKILTLLLVIYSLIKVVEYKPEINWLLLSLWMIPTIILTTIITLLLTPLILVSMEYKNSKIIRLENSVRGKINENSTREKLREIIIENHLDEIAEHCKNKIRNGDVEEMKKIQDCLEELDR